MSNPILVDNDEEGFNTLDDVRAMPDGATMIFLVKSHGAARAELSDGLIYLHPERSQAHRALLASLRGSPVGKAAIDRGAMSPEDRQAARDAMKAGQDPPPE